MSNDFPGGRIDIDRRLDGAVVLRVQPKCVVVSPENAVKIAQAILEKAGVAVQFASPGETVIRPPRGGLVGG